MEVKNKKISIVGRSKGLSSVFNFYFKDNKIETISFREAWRNIDQIKESDTIVLSGFHFNICTTSLIKLDKYIDDYITFIDNIKKKCSNLYLVCTDLDIPFSTSRVVYFYYNLLKKINFDENIKILSLKTVYKEDKNFIKKVKIKILKLLISSLTNFNDLDSDINNYRITSLKKISFLLIFIPRTRTMDRIIRLFFDLILIKKISERWPSG